MIHPVDDKQKRQARTPHEVLMMNLAAFHLLLGPATLALNIGAWGLALIPLFSGMVIAYIYKRGHRPPLAPDWFATMHWRLAWRRCRLLLIAYLVSAVIIGAGALLSMTASKPSMQDIIFTIATRVGVMPTIITVLVVFVMANSGLEMAGKGEVPDSLAQAHPPPAE